MTLFVVSLLFIGGFVFEEKFSRDFPNFKSLSLFSANATSGDKSVLGYVQVPFSNPTELTLKAVSFSGSEFQVELSDEDPLTSLGFSPEIELEMIIDGANPTIVNSDSGKAIKMLFGDEMSRTFSFDSTTIPSGSSGSYAMVLKEKGSQDEYTIIPLSLNVHVSCSDPSQSTYLDCFFNCGIWGMTW